MKSVSGRRTLYLRLHLYKQGHLSSNLLTCFVIDRSIKNTTSGGTVPDIHVTTPRKDLWQKDQLLWNIMELIDFNHSHSMPTSFYFNSIDEILASSSDTGAAGIDQVLYDYLSDLAAMTEALAAIKYHVGYMPSLTFDRVKDNKVPIEMGEETGLVAKGVTEHATGEDRIWAKIEQLRKLPEPSLEITEQSVSPTKELHQALNAVWLEVKKVKGPLLKDKVWGHEYDQ